MYQRLEVLRTVSDVSSFATMPPKRWYECLAHYQQTGVAHVLATVVAINGSAPRALQAKMLITRDSYCDTLGGGGLEHDVTMTARQLLNGEIEQTVSNTTKSTDAQKNNANASNTGTEAKQAKKAVRRDSVYTKHYPLGAKLAQCCGGSVTIMFECFNVTPPLSILVFGAGHVAAALLTILAHLPCQVDWVDSREEMFAPYLLSKQSHTDQPTLEQPAVYHLPAHIRPHVSEEPIDFIRSFIEPSSQQNAQHFILIMTHDHALDFDLVRAAIDVGTACDNLPYIGCISSATKAKRFKDRLLQRNYDAQIVEQLAMPIGLPLGGKEPMAVAVSIAAQILQHYYQS